MNRRETKEIEKRIEFKDGEDRFVINVGYHYYWELLPEDELRGRWSFVGTTLDIFHNGMPVAENDTIVLSDWIQRLIRDSVADKLPRESEVN